MRNIAWSAIVVFVIAPHDPRSHYWQTITITFDRRPGKQTGELAMMSMMNSVSQGGITFGVIDEPRKSSKAIDECVIINFRDKNVVIAHFRDKNVVIARFRDKTAYVLGLRYG